MVYKGAAGALVTNLTLTKMNAILEKANGLLKAPVASWAKTNLTQIPRHCSHGVTGTDFSIWFGDRTGAVYVVVYSEKVIYKSIK